MAVKLIKEEFNWLDVSNIKIENRLAVGGGEDSPRELIARSEDEAFIRQFVIDRHGAKYGAQRAYCWAEKGVWINALIDIGVLQQGIWIKKEIKENDKLVPDIVCPDPEKDQVDDYMAVFGYGEHFYRYLESLVYKEDWEIDLWIIENVQKSIINAKRADVLGMIYKDLAKMNIAALGPKDGFYVNAKAEVFVDCIKNVDFEHQEKVGISIESDAKLKFYKNQGVIQTDDKMEEKFTHPDGDVRSYAINPTLILNVSGGSKELKDGRDGESGPIVYKEEQIYTRQEVDIEIDFSGFTYVDGCNKELAIAILAAFVFVEAEVAYYNEETGAMRGYSSEFVVKATTEKNIIRIGDEVRSLVEKLLPKYEGELNKKRIQICEIGFIADVSWNTRLDDEN
ncbi:MAG: hypothetical protein E7046_05715 [Lentisphaerae bacterium]|nr:hypothetical protein [Lentisphaerota bacterium]